MLLDVHRDSHKLLNHYRLGINKSSNDDTMLTYGKAYKD